LTSTCVGNVGYRKGDPTMPHGPSKEHKASPENRRKTGEANLAHGEPFRFKPGQSGNPGGRPRSARLSEAYRAKLESDVPGDSRGRTYVEAIADALARRALKGDLPVIKSFKEK